MTGLKSGSGDDLWDDADEDVAGDDGADGGDSADDADSTDDVTGKSGREGATDGNADESAHGEGGAEQESDGVETGSKEGETGSNGGETSSSVAQPYIVRRALQDKSIQFERDERLTFFVHDDVVDGERELLTEVESALGRDVPKFDVREAVYRAALRNPDDVLDELLQMGYALDDE